MEKGRVEGKSVTVLREAWQGDLGYDEKKNQVLVEFEDGVKTAVSYPDVKDRRRNVPEDIPPDELFPSFVREPPEPPVELPERYKLPPAKKPVVKTFPRGKK